MGRQGGANPLATLQHPGVDLSIELQEPARSSGNSLVPALSVLDQVAEEIFLHCPGLSPTHFSNGIDPGGNDFTADARMDKLCGEFLDDGGEGVWWSEVVHALCKRNEDGGYAELMIGEVFEDVGIKWENRELVRTHDAREELHEKDLVV